MQEFFVKLLYKLGSRKLWAAIVTVAIAVAAAFFGDELSEEAVDALRCAAAAAIAYIFGESAVDAAGTRR